MSLLEKLKKSRQTDIQAGGYTFTVKRPTAFDLGEFKEGEFTAKHILNKFVVGWDLKEIDIIPGGDNVAAPFDPALFVEWVADHQDIWAVLQDGIWAAYTAHNKQQEDRLGEADAG